MQANPCPEAVQSLLGGRIQWLSLVAVNRRRLCPASICQDIYLNAYSPSVTESYQLVVLLLESVLLPVTHHQDGLWSSLQRIAQLLL